MCKPTYSNDDVNSIIDSLRISDEAVKILSDFLKGIDHNINTQNLRVFNIIDWLDSNDKIEAQAELDLFEKEIHIS